MPKKYANVTNADRPVASIKNPRTVFSRHKKLITEFDVGWLIPVYISEVIPSETTSFKMHSFFRMATPLVAIFDNMFLASFTFYIPYRILWDNFVRMMGQRDNPDDSIDYAFPTIVIDPNTADPLTLRLLDYLGIPIANLNTAPPGSPPVYNTLEINSLPLRAINFIYNQFFRDKNLQDSKVLHLNDGVTETQDDYKLFRRGKKFDYFTHGAESPQKGDPVIVPITGDTDGSLPVQGLGWDRSAGTSAANTGVVVNPSMGDWQNPVTYPYSKNAGAGFPGLVIQTLDGDSGTGVVPNVRVDLSSASMGVAISDLRDGFAVQAILEMDLVGGTDYPDSQSYIYGMTIPYSDLKRPEYIGGGVTSVMVHPVTQTSSSSYGASDGTPQGNVGAFGTCMTGSGSGHSFYKTFYEHGLVISFISVNADLSYQQGLDRIWTDSVRLDLHHPALNNTAEQPVYTREIYCTGDPANDNKIFMFKDQYARKKEDFAVVTGKMRSNSVDVDGNSNTADVYHLAELFGSAPEYTGEFIESKPPLNRVKAVQDEPDFLADIQFIVDSARPLPAYSKPPNLVGTRL